MRVRDFVNRGMTLCDNMTGTFCVSLHSESKQQSSQRKSAAFLHWTFNQYMEFGRELKRHGILEVSCALCAA